MSATAEQIARAFSDKLIAYNGVRLIKEMNRRNGTPAYKDCCASHDFCDANMVMLAAFESLGLPDPLERLATGVAPDFTLWNEAWELARSNKFYLEAK